MEISNGNGVPLIVEALIVHGIQYPNGFITISGYEALQHYYATTGDYDKAIMYRDHQVKRMKNIIR